ncbi:hypothetical protein RDI58_001314 [Solanum bulbocastanum]|uniref:SKP1 component dimerisation domain-containing protein n=1 Tax=Solanum bulbocastanum TaxID=147425 RepID=A0AAN8UCG3_SOLBU
MRFQVLYYVHNSVLFDVLLGANNLDDKELKDVMIQEVAERITGKTPKEKREEFRIVSDYTPKGEEEVRRENAWGFE